MHFRSSLYSLSSHAPGSPCYLLRSQFCLISLAHEATQHWPRFYTTYLSFRSITLSCWPTGSSSVNSLSFGNLRSVCLAGYSENLKNKANNKLNDEIYSFHRDTPGSMRHAQAIILLRSLQCNVGARRRVGSTTQTARSSAHGRIPIPVRKHRVCGSNARPLAGRASKAIALRP